MYSTLTMNFFYDLKIKQSQMTQNYYQEQRVKCLEILGDKYLLAVSVKRKT